MFFHRLVSMRGIRDLIYFNAVRERIDGDYPILDTAAILESYASREDSKQLLDELREDDRVDDIRWDQHHVESFDIASNQDEIEDNDTSSDLSSNEDHGSMDDQEPAKYRNELNLAVARKLTIASELNPRFLADRRLWHWIEDALSKR